MRSLLYTSFAQFLPWIPEKYLTLKLRATTGLFGLMPSFSPYVTSSSLFVIRHTVGFLTAEGDIDTENTRRAVEAADGMGITFHRAFDECRNPKEALEQIIDCGCHKLLTSGCKATAWEGREMLKKLLSQAGRRIGIIGASGIRVDNVHQLVLETGLYEVHASLKHTVDGLTCTAIDQVREFMNITDDFPNYPPIN